MQRQKSMALRDKLKKHHYFAGLSETDLAKISQKLSDANGFKGVFFAKKDLEAYEIASTWKDQITSSALGQIPKMMTKEGTITNLLRNSIVNIDEDDEDKKIRQSLQNMWRIKLILLGSLAPFGFISRTMGAAKQHKYGLFRAAIQVGHRILEWDKESSLCIPVDAAEFAQSDAICALDLEYLDGQDVQDEIVAKLCQMLVSWNITNTYSDVSCNCQHFVDAALKVMGINPKFEGVIGNFLKELQSAESFDKVKFTYQYQNDKKATVHNFTTHQHLDEVVADLVGQKGQYNIPQEDLLLLKAFDRMFWLRYKALQGNPNSVGNDYLEEINKYKPATVCFFGDPIESGTISGGYHG